MPIWEFPPSLEGSLDRESEETQDKEPSFNDIISSGKYPTYLGAVLADVAMKGSADAKHLPNKFEDITPEETTK